MNLQSLFGSEPEEDESLPLVVVVDDDREVARLGGELCAMAGARGATYASTLQLIRAMNDGLSPQAVVLDWRLEREVSAGLFLALRHRFPRLPIMLWTGVAADQLPDMVLQDPLTRIVVKGEGTRPFMAAVRWALDATATEVEMTELDA